MKIYFIAVKRADTAKFCEMKCSIHYTILLFRAGIRPMEQQTSMKNIKMKYIF